jgi:hypothetical protein
VDNGGSQNDYFIFAIEKFAHKLNIGSLYVYSMADFLENSAQSASGMKCKACGAQEPECIFIHEDSEYRADNSAYGLPNSGLRAFGATQQFARAAAVQRFF